MIMEARSMKRSLFSLAFLGLAAFGVLGCADEDPAVNRVNINVVDKSIFEGSWYSSSVVIDVDYESAGFGTFQGDSAYNLTAGGMNQFSIERVRWVIDENYLYAYRDYEIIQEHEEATLPEGELGQPVAVF